MTVFRRVLCFISAGGGSIVPKGGTVVGGKCHVTGSLPSETFSLSLRVCESVFETIGKNWRERSRDLMERTIRDLVALQNEKEKYLDSVQRRCF